MTVIDLVEAEPEDEQRTCSQCNSDEPMVHKYGLVRDPVTRYPEEGGYWECPECGGVE